MIEVVGNAVYFYFAQVGPLQVHLQHIEGSDGRVGSRRTALFILYLGEYGHESSQQKQTFWI